MRYTVYKIVCEKTQKCVYVGATRNKLEHRLQQHLYSKNLTGEWARNNAHRIEALSVHSDAAVAAEAETTNIQKLKPRFNLVTRSHFANMNGGRKKGQKNINPRKLDDVIFVYTGSSLHAWISALPGKSNSSKVAAMLTQAMNGADVITVPQ